MNLDTLPRIPHQHVADVNCGGHLMIEIRSDQAAILCNECRAIIRVVRVEEVEDVVLQLSVAAAIAPLPFG
jgi:hypothetical protein